MLQRVLTLINRKQTLTAISFSTGNTTAKNMQLPFMKPKAAIQQHGTETRGWHTVQTEDREDEKVMVQPDSHIVGCWYVD